MEICKSIPFLIGREYCYGPVGLSFWDKAFVLVIIVALMAIGINEIQRRFK
jgi:hypothetical protein